MGEHPRSVEDIVRNFQMRREGLLKALTTGAPRPAPRPGPARAGGRWGEKPSLTMAIPLRAASI